MDAISGDAPHTTPPRAAASSSGATSVLTPRGRCGRRLSGFPMRHNDGRSITISPHICTTYPGTRPLRRGSVRWRPDAHASRVVTRSKLSLPVSTHTSVPSGPTARSDRQHDLGLLESSIWLAELRMSVVHVDYTCGTRGVEILRCVAGGLVALAAATIGLLCVSLAVARPSDAATVPPWQNPTRTPSLGLATSASGGTTPHCWSLQT